MSADREKLVDETMEKWEAHGCPELDAKFFLNELRLNLFAARKAGDIKEANHALQIAGTIIGAFKSPPKRSYVRRTPRGLAENFETLNEWLGEVINKTSE